MRHATIRSALVAAMAGLFVMTGGAAAQAAHAHMGHVADGWGDAPDGAGLLPTAAAEADIASTHAGLAVSNASDLAAIKAHIGHVANAVDPTVETAGPGKGYGLIKAATGAATHIRLAAESDDASDNVKLHATHVATSADNVVARAQRIMELAAEVKATDDVAAAAAMAEEIQELTQAIVSGHDADGDGRVSWGEGEGGLEQAAFHMDLMKKGEGTDK